MIAVLTRLLTPTQYGTYSLTILTAGLVSAVCMQWVNLGVGRYLPECAKQNTQGPLLGSARAVTLLISCCLAVVFLCIGYLSENLGYSIIFGLVGFIAGAQAWYDLNLKIKNAALAPLGYGLMLSAKSVLTFGLVSLAVYLGFGPKGAVVAMVVALVLASLSGYRIWNRIPWKITDRQQLARLWRYGAPLTATYLFVFIIDASDRFFIDRLMGGHALGTYSAAYEFSQYSIGAIMSVVHLAAFPLVVSALANEGLAGAQRQLTKTFTVLLVVALPVTAGLATVSDNVAAVVMGANFRMEGALLIPWISLALLFACAKSYYFDYPFQLAGATRTQLIPVALAAVANLVFNYFLIPVFGLMGAAAATILSFLIALMGSIFWGRRVFRMPPLPWIDPLKIVLASVIMVTAIANIDTSNKILTLVIQVGAGLVIYSSCVFVTNVLGCRHYITGKVSGWRK